MWTERIVDREGQQKLYVQLYAIIRDKIVAREWPTGSQIPTEDDLCRTYDVSKATIRMAISELVRDGFLRKQQGRGTFVTYSSQESGITMKTRLTEDMFGEGVNVKKELLVRGVQEPTGHLKDLLKTGGDVYYILCKRVVNGDPAYLEESFLPLDRVPDVESEDVCQMSFYNMVQQRAVQKIHKVVQSIELSEVRGDAAAILKTDEGTSVLLLHRLLVGADGIPIAYTRLTGTGRKYKLQTELIQIP